MKDIAELAVTQVGLPIQAMNDRVAVVTGAGRGIGQEIARAFAHLGAKVVIAEITDAGKDTESRIHLDGGEALFIKTDVSNEEDTIRLAQMTSEAFGPANVLVNNAILCPSASVLDMDVSMWDRVMAVNLCGTFLMCKAFLPGMIQERKGVIVNMISTDAMPYLSAYIASKKGIAGFSRSLAGEVGDYGIRVIAFAPGFVDTPGLRSAAAELSPHMGLSEEQFMGLSMHPTYSKAMPADHAAAGTAYLVVALANDYHGDEVNVYTVLERAGFIQAAGDSAENPLTIPIPIETGASRVASIQSALELCRQFAFMLTETEAELNKLPVFVRPLARQGFKNKSGQSLLDWTKTADSLTEILKSGEDSGISNREKLVLQFPRIQAQLKQLTQYYADVPAETARFTKDPEVLTRIKELTDQRIALVHSLSSLLQEIA